MTDRRRRAANAEPSHEDNPFAPPAEGTPDQPWQPRRPAGSDDSGEADEGGGDGRDGRGRGGDGQNDDKPTRWGRQWSNRQPGRQGGGFGMPGSSGSGKGNGNGGNGREPGGRRNMRWDPTDPLQRRARYALHAGIWGLFFALFSLTEIALLLGALSVYWGISALRGGSNGKPGASGSGAETGTHASAEDIAGSDRSAAPDGDGAFPPKPGTPPVQVSVTPEQAARARSTAAVSGLIAGGLSLAIVAATFTVQMIYSDYYTCKQDALTTSSREQCKDLLPEEVRPFLTERE